MTDRQRNLLTVATLLSLVLIAFHNALPDEFVYDSAAIVAEHHLLAEGSRWWEAFTHSYWGMFKQGGLYRPLTILSYWIEKRALGFEQAWPHGAVNVALHATAALLLWRLGSRWASRSAAFAGAALFAVHPLATEAVPNLVGRADLLALIGVLGALLFWERWLTRPTWRYLAAATLLWLVGLLSKESAVMFPLMAYVRHLWVLRDRAATAQEATLPLPIRPLVMHHSAYAVVAAIGAAWLAVWQWGNGQGPPNYEFGLDNPLVLAEPLSRWMTVVMIWGIAIRNVVFPLWLSADYSPQAIPLVTEPWEPAYLVSLLAVILIAYASVVGWKRRSPAALGVVFFVCGFLPVSNLVVLIGTIMADRLLYLPMAGLCLAAGVVAAAVTRTAAKRQRRAAHLAALAVLVAALGLLTVRTWQRNAIWKSSEVFYPQMAEDSPRSWRAWSRLVSQYAKPPRTQDRLDSAVHAAQQMLHALRAYPAWAFPRSLIDAGAVHIERGELLAKLGLKSASDADLARGIDLTLGGLRSLQLDSPRLRAIDESQAWAQERKLPPRTTEDELYAGYANLAKAFYALDRFDLATTAFDSALRYREPEIEVLVVFARSLANSGRLKAARVVLIQAIERDPESESLRRDLATVNAAIERASSGQHQ